MFDDKEFLNDLVEKNLAIGSPKLKHFKKIIRKVSYPFPGDLTAMHIAHDAIAGYKTMSKDQEEILELMVYCCECSVNYLCDVYDMENESFRIAEDMFGKTVKLLKESSPNHSDQFKPRLKELVILSQVNDHWVGRKKLTTIWHEAFQEKVKINRYQFYKEKKALEKEII